MAKMGGHLIIIDGEVVGSDVFCVEWHCEESELLGVVGVRLSFAFNDYSDVFACAFVHLQL